MQRCVAIVWTRAGLPHDGCVDCDVCEYSVVDGLARYIVRILSYRRLTPQICTRSRETLCTRPTLAGTPTDTSTYAESTSLLVDSCGSLQSLPSTQQSTVYPNPPVDSRHFTPQLSYVYAHLHFVFACCYVASYNLHSDGLTNLANTDTPGSELPRDVPRTAVCSSFPVALLFCRSPKALSLASLAGMRRARPRWPPFIIL